MAEWVQLSCTFLFWIIFLYFYFILFSSLYYLLLLMKVSVTDQNKQKKSGNIVLA